MRKDMETVLNLALILSLANLSVAQTALGTVAPKKASEQMTVQKAPVKPRIVHHLIYTNNRYGFRFYLPMSWKGYSITQLEWDGSSNSEANLEEHGRIIWIEHPLSTEQNPREGIPIMVFTHKQWREVDGGDISVSAAPFGPGEIERNTKYVFATPPRFFYDYLDGWEEVIKILHNKPLRTFESANSASPHRPPTGWR